MLNHCTLRNCISGRTLIFFTVSGGGCNSRPHLDLSLCGTVLIWGAAFRVCISGPHFGICISGEVHDWARGWGEGDLQAGLGLCAAETVDGVAVKVKRLIRERKRTEWNWIGAIGAIRCVPNYFDKYDKKSWFIF